MREHDVQAPRQRRTIPNLQPYKAQHTLTEVARLLGRHRSTISREIERDRGGRGYRAEQACRKAQPRVLATCWLKAAIQSELFANKNALHIDSKLKTSRAVP